MGRKTFVVKIIDFLEGAGRARTSVKLFTKANLCSRLVRSTKHNPLVDMCCSTNCRNWNGNKVEKPNGSTGESDTNDNLSGGGCRGVDLPQTVRKTER